MSLKNFNFLTQSYEYYDLLNSFDQTLT